MIRRKLLPETVARAMQTSTSQGREGNLIITGMAKNATILTPELCSLLDNYRYSHMDVT